jgi:tripartite-type tricarboxylate transporter receptor subunit TctC
LSVLAPGQSQFALAITPTVIVVNGGSPYRTLEDLLSAARAKPGDLTLGATPGTVLNVAFEMLLERAANVHMTFVPFPSTAPAVSSVLGGQVMSA